jgi:hypothetical protein
VSESEFYDHTPGNDKYLINYHVVLQGKTTPPRVCEPRRTGLSRSISKKTIPTIAFIRTSRTMTMKIDSVAMATITPMKSGHLQGEVFSEQNRRKRREVGDGSLVIVRLRMMARPTQGRFFYGDGSGPPGCDRRPSYWRGDVINEESS